MLYFKTALILLSRLGPQSQSKFLIKEGLLILGMCLPLNSGLTSVHSTQFSALQPPLFSSLNGFIDMGLSGLLSLLATITPRLVCLIGSRSVKFIIGSDLPRVEEVNFLAHGILFIRSAFLISPGVEATESGVAQL